MSQLYTAIFYSDTVSEIFSDESLLGFMLEVEVALANAQAKVGVIPKSASTTIENVVKAQGIHLLDIPKLATASGLAGNVAIPFVKQLTAAIKAVDEEAARYVHWGATSQDIIDTATILQARAAFAVIEPLLQQIHQQTRHLAKTQRNQLMIGRTWLQQALPITFGHKAARWASVYRRDIERLTQIKTRCLTVQLGGAVGSLASLDDKGSEVVTAFANALDLSAPDCTWHGERDRIIDMANVLATIIGNTANIAKDWSLLTQTEIAEVYEPTGEGRGGSSTMPHKRNPVAAAAILAAGNRTPALMASLYQSLVQEHERSLGAWHAEWLALPELFKLCAGGLEKALDVLKGLEINADNMQKNLATTRGLIMAEALMMALAPKIGRMQAHTLVEKLCKQAVKDNHHLLAIAQADTDIGEHFSSEQLTKIFDPANYLGNIQQQIDRVLGLT